MEFEFDGSTIILLSCTILVFPHPNTSVAVFLQFCDAHENFMTET